MTEAKACCVDLVSIGREALGVQGRERSEQGSHDGAIGCEFASFLVDAGSNVTILEALPQILTGVDQQVAQTVVRAFQKRGVTTHTGVRVMGFDGKAVRFRQFLDTAGWVEALRPF